MKDSTCDYLISLLRKDSIVKQKGFSSKDINIEIIEKFELKIKKEYKIMRWIMAVTLILLLSTFIYLSIIEVNYTKIAGRLISFWFIYLGSFTATIFVSKTIWNSKRNLLILDLFKKELF